MSQEIPKTVTFPQQLDITISNMGILGQELPGVMQGFGGLHKASTVPGALDTKTKELIALAIGVAARCDGCIAYHTHDCLKAGATRAEIMEALGVAIMMGGGPSVMYATHVVEAIDQFNETGIK